MNLIYMVRFHEDSVERFKLPPAMSVGPSASSLMISLEASRKADGPASDYSFLGAST